MVARGATQGLYLALRANCNNLPHIAPPSAREGFLNLKAKSGRPRKTTCIDSAHDQLGPSWAPFIKKADWGPLFTLADDKMQLNVRRRLI
jgi:hypothetical protein